MRECSVTDCERVHFARGYCCVHYSRWQRGTEVDRPVVTRGRSLAERLADKYIVDETTGCWVWTNATEEGYGRIRVGGAGSKRTPAHRAMYEIVVGPIPDGLQLDHLCRNRACINPDHLDPVTLVENVLRGDGITATQARRTHCKRGHEYDAVRSDGKGRICTTCRRERRVPAASYAV